METEAISIPAAGAAYLGEPAAQPVAEHSAAQAMADQSQICTGAAQSGETAPETCKVDEEIRPDHYYGDTKIPVFKPTMEQFRSFKDFVDKIDAYGMKAGIVKVIPPNEWRDSLPDLSESVKSVKIKNPIVQHIHGGQGRYRQTNVQKQRTYNLMEWKHACQAEDHQPPARRGERRKMVDTRLKQTPPRMPKKSNQVALRPGEKRKRGRPKGLTYEVLPSTASPVPEAPPTPPTPTKDSLDEVEPHALYDATLETKDPWGDFNYKLENLSEFTYERCEELEKVYWKTLTYNEPMYGADMPGSLFNESTKDWNVANLDNILNVLGRRLPGVNTAYLYLGMWKATFSWHVEDMDLYSINYIHFGAPKQWYSISQEDAHKFERVMRDEHKKCSQYLRHKSFLISPTTLASYGIQVNKLVHYAGEFVITFPFGYHSGYNLGYNCAESVNFATESWLDYGKDARKCDCISDAVWINVDEIIGRLNGEIVDDPVDFPTPPASDEGGSRPNKRRRMGLSVPAVQTPVRKGPIIKLPEIEPCCLCPNDIADELLPTVEGLEAHRLCATLIPETCIRKVGEDDQELVAGVKQIPKARSDLKCLYCHRKRGACFQCDASKCVRAYHATCAPMAGVLVENVANPEGDPTWNLKCRFHRPKRQPVELLENDPLFLDYGASLQPNQVVQAQYSTGDIFAGVVKENNPSEKSVVLDVLVEGDTIDLAWKWLLAPSSKGSANVHRLSRKPGRPKADRGLQSSLAAAKASADTQQFLIQWQPFETAEPEGLDSQVQVDGGEIWYYLPDASTLCVDRYSDDPANKTPSTRADVNLIRNGNRRKTAAERAKEKEDYAAISTVHQQIHERLDTVAKYALSQPTSMHSSKPISQKAALQLDKKKAAASQGFNHYQAPSDAPVKPSPYLFAQQQLQQSFHQSQHTIEPTSHPHPHTQSTASIHDLVAAALLQEQAGQT